MWVSEFVTSASWVSGWGNPRIMWNELKPLRSFSLSVQSDNIGVWEGISDNHSLLEVLFERKRGIARVDMRRGAFNSAQQ